MPLSLSDGSPVIRSNELSMTTASSFTSTTLHNASGWRSSQVSREIDIPLVSCDTDPGRGGPVGDSARMWRRAFPPSAGGWAISPHAISGSIGSSTHHRVSSIRQSWNTVLTTERRVTEPAPVIVHSAPARGQHLRDRDRRAGTVHNRDRRAPESSQLPNNRPV